LHTQSSSGTKHPPFFEEGFRVRMMFEFEAGDSLVTLEEFRSRSEAAYLKAVVERIGHRGNAALALGISRKSLWERLRLHGLGGLRIKRREAEELRRVATVFNVAA